MSNKLSLTGEEFAAILVLADIGIDSGVEFSVLNQIVLPHETLATVGPIARMSSSGVNVPMSVQMRLLSEPFAAVFPIADVWLVCGAALMTIRVTIVRVFARQLSGHY